MFNKSLVFGLFAASLMIAPTTAFAGVNQSQNNVQTTEQNGVATNGSTNAQESNSINVQHQISNIQSRTHGYGYNYHRPVGRANQSQNSAQSTSQNGAADNGSTNAQTSKTVNHQNQGSRINNRRGWW